jgi:O-methyltransferase
MIKKIYYLLPNTLRELIFHYSKIIVNTGDLESNFINSDIGANFGLSKKDKKDIIKQINYILGNVKSATNLNVHLTLLEYLFKSARSNDKSCIVEAGCYHGASSCILSLGAEIVKKKLIIYDSFRGLPKINEEQDKEHIYDHFSSKGTYEEGMYSSSLKNVKANINKYGRFDHCEFREGFFNETMHLHKEKIDFIFIDVDLLSSTKDAIKFLWPYLKDKGFFFTDDAANLLLNKIWFDDILWLA